MDSYDKNEFNRITAEYNINFIGAMGKKSKDLAAEQGVEVVCNSGVIDKSILNAITGSRCLILTSRGMVSHTAKRVRDYIQSSGIRLVFSPVGKGAVATDSCQEEEIDYSEAE